MSIVAIVSMKGGVGKTSTTANVAAALAARLGGAQVSVVDLDPQNSLHLHFGLGTGGAHQKGVCELAVHGGQWGEIMHPSPFGVLCLPYGSASEDDRLEFEALLEREPGWLGQQLSQAGLDRAGVVLIDTPPGPSVYLRQVFACADLVLMVLLADAGSYATVPAMESWLKEAGIQRPNLKARYLLNQVDTSVPLNRDVAEVLRQHLGERMLQMSVHRDEAVGEALAFQQPVISYDPHGQATRDLCQLAGWVVDALD